MAVKTIKLTVPTQGPMQYPLTELIEESIMTSGIREGTVTIFCQHTSCSLMIMEQADPGAWKDLINYMNRLVPANYPGFTHRVEGPDDMPAHVKMALTRTSEVIPFSDGKLCLGSWQAIFLWEHRTRPFTRELVLSIQGE